MIVIDSDLQDPPELIPELVKSWRDGHDVVYGKRISRDGETAPKKTTAHLFYRFIQGVSHVCIPEDTGDFRLLSRRAVEGLKQFREQQATVPTWLINMPFRQKEALPLRCIDGSDRPQMGRSVGTPLRPLSRCQAN